jgi:hypothetical protein
MKKVKLEDGNAALERVLLMMNYDMGKTLSENKELVKPIEEQSLSQITKSAVRGAVTGAAAGAPLAGIGAIPGAIVGALAGAVMGAVNNPKMDQIKKMFQACKTEKSKPTLSISQLDTLSDEINSAIEGLGTDEEAILNSLKQIPTIPDLCGLIKAYEIHGDLFDDLDGDLENDTEWKNYVLVPLRGAIRKSQEITSNAKQNSSSDTQSGTGKEKIDW